MIWYKMKCNKTHLCCSLLKASQVADVEKILDAKFKKRDGPFFRSLEESMAKLHVERQAFRGATFVGNHVHKLLKVYSFVYTLHSNSVSFLVILFQSSM